MTAFKFHYFSFSVVPKLVSLIDSILQIQCFMETNTYVICPINMSLKSICSENKWLQVSIRKFLFSSKKFYLSKVCFYGVETTMGLFLTIGRNYNCYSTSRRFSPPSLEKTFWNNENFVKPQLFVFISHTEWRNGNFDF